MLTQCAPYIRRLCDLLRKLLCMYFFIVFHVYVMRQEIQSLIGHMRRRNV